MLRNRVRRAVKVGDGVAGFASVLVRLGRKLSVVCVFVAIQAGRKLHFIQGLLTGGNVTFVAFHLCVHSLQGILRRSVLLHAE